MQSRNRRLAGVLRLDAAFCYLCGLFGLVAPSWVARFLLPDTPSVLGTDTSSVMFAVGVALLLYGAVLFAVSLPAPISEPLVRIFAIADAGWVIATVILLALAGAAFSAWGAIALIVVAAEVGLLGALKLWALRSEALQPVAS